MNRKHLAAFVALCITCLTFFSSTAAEDGVSGRGHRIRGSLRVDSLNTRSFQDKTELQEWTVHEFGLERLTVRLLHIADGEVRTGNETVLWWDRPEPSGTAGKISLLKADGKVFGAEYKQSVSLSVDFDNSAPMSRSIKSTSLVIERKRHDTAFQAINGGEINFAQNGDVFLYNEAFFAEGSKPTIADDLDSLTAQSKKGDQFIVVVLNREPN